MSAEIFVQIDTSELEKRFALLPKQMELAAKRAAIRTREWLRTQLTRELATTARVPQKALKGRVRRGPKANDGAWYSNGQAVLWIGLNEVAAHHVGTPRQTKKGVRVEKHFFDRAFIVRIGHSQRLSVWRRQGRKRTPIAMVTVPLDEAGEDLLEKYEAPAARTFSQRLEHEVNFLLENAT